MPIYIEGGYGNFYPGIPYAGVLFPNIDGKILNVLTLCPGGSQGQRFLPLYLLIYGEEIDGAVGGMDPNVPKISIGTVEPYTNILASTLTTGLLSTNDVYWLALPSKTVIPDLNQDISLVITQASTATTYFFSVYLLGIMG